MDNDVRVLIKFDSIDAHVPKEAKVSEALLSIYVYDTCKIDAESVVPLNSWDPSSRSKEIYQISTSWNDKDVSWLKPWKGVNNQGGEYVKETKQSSFNNTLGVWQTFKVTDMVKHFIEKPSENYGFIIKYMDAGVSTGTVSYSSECSDITKRPKLMIYYR